MGNQICGKDFDLCSTGAGSENSYRKMTQTGNKKKLSYFISSSNICDEYIILHPPIGKGSYGCVYKALHRSTNIMRAVKMITKKGQSLRELQQILILKKLDHPNVIRIYEIYVEEYFIYIVMEYCSGGQLFERILQHKTITENQAKNYMKQLLSAIANCHSNNVMHRDLKPQNIMLASKESKDIKIVDFGAGTCYQNGKTETLKIGSIYYMAPEVIRKNYSQKCDVWSLGVILYVMLSGIPPFNGKSDKIIYQKILSGKLEFPEKKWSKISLQARNLIRNMLEYDPQKRISARQALLSTWILSATNQGNNNLFKANEMQVMRDFCKMNKFQSAVVSYISYNLVETQSLNKLQQVFKNLDFNNDGKISWKEFKSSYLENMPPISEEELLELFKKLDQNNSGFIDYTEFIASAFHKNCQQNDSLFQKAFKLIDKDGDGFIDRQQLQISFGFGDPELCQQMMRQADLNGDKKISKKQFKAVMKNFKSQTDTQGTKDSKNQ